MTFDNTWGPDQIRFGTLTLMGECTIRPDADVTFGEWEIVVNALDWNRGQLPQIGVPGYLEINGHEESVFAVFVNRVESLPYGKVRIRIGSVPEYKAGT